MLEKTILLIATGILHPPILAVRRLASIVKAQAKHAWMVPSVESLPRIDLAGVAALVLYFHRKTISEAALDALDNFVSSGGGVLAVHSASASFKQCSRYFKILGGRFVGHGRVASFEARPVAGSSKPFTGMDGFRIRDEVYLHETEPGIRVHFETTYQGGHLPVVWTYRYGAGRVCYAMPGHGSGAFKNPGYQKILTRGLGWVTESS